MSRFQRYIPAVLWAIAGAAIVLVIVVIGQIRTTQVNHNQAVTNGSDAAVAAEKGTQRIEDCTTPGQPCYDHGQKQLAKKIAALIDSQQKSAAASASCGAQLAPVLATLSKHQGFLRVYACQQAQLRTLSH